MALFGALLGLQVYLFYLGWIGTGILMVLPLLIVGLLIWRHERIVIAMYHMRKQNMDKAYYHVSKIGHPEALPKRQEAYVYYLLGLTGSQVNSMAKSESLLRKALNTGLKNDLDKAFAKVQLAAFAMQKRRKREAMNLLAEVKKLDKDGLLNEQVRMLKKNMGRI